MSQVIRSCPEIFYKMNVPKILQNPQENTCARVSHLIKLQASRGHKCCLSIFWQNMWIKCHLPLHSHYYHCQFALIFLSKGCECLMISLYFSSKKALNILSCVATFFTSSKIFDFLTEKKTAFKKAHSNNRFILIIIQISVLFDVISQVSNE